jgi:4-amino-4-deoxy-L-arabinose transferase-like glycosyltransferase
VVGLGYISKTKNKSGGTKMSDTKVTINLSKLSSRLRLNNLPKLNITHLLLLLLALHLFVATQPNDGMIFDESHYVKASIATLQGTAANIEHTPLTKIFMAISIKVFGDYWFGWRFPAVICAVLSIYVFYRLATKYVDPKKALLASAFLGFDSLFFVNTGIALLDPPAVLFSLIGIERFVNKKYKTAAFAFGVAFLCKEVTFLVVVGVLAFHIINTLRVKPRRIFNRKIYKSVALVSCVFLTVSLGGLYIYDIYYHPTMGGSVVENQSVVVYVGNQTDPALPKFNETLPVTSVTTTHASTNMSGATIVSNPIQHLRFAFGYFEGLVPSVQSNGSDYRPPWGWILPAENTFNPPQYLSVAVSVGDQSKLTLAWQSAINPVVEFMFIPEVVICFYCMFISKKNVEYALLVSCLLLATYLPWLWLGMFVQRMTFNYYFLYTVPALALGIPLLWDTVVKNEKIKWVGMLLQFAVCMGVFMYYFPIVLFR